MNKPMHTVDGTAGTISATTPRPVTQDWVHGLSLMQQSVLLSAIRGCDGIPKRHKSKSLVKWYRRCILLAAFDGQAKISPCEEGGGSFAGPIASIPPGLSKDEVLKFEADQLKLAADDFVDSRDELPFHYQIHMIHAFEVLGYKHPSNSIREFWNILYVRLAHCLHMWPESEAEMDSRLGDTLEGWRARNDNSSVCSD